MIQWLEKSRGPQDYALCPGNTRDPEHEEGPQGDSKVLPGREETTERRRCFHTQSLINGVNSADGQVRRGWRTALWITRIAGDADPI